VDLFFEFGSFFASVLWY